MGDLARGYDFTDGLVDDCSSAHLHDLVDDAEIQTSFHTDKSSAGADPAKATHEVMLYRNSDATWRKGTIGAVFFDSAELITNRTAKTAPVSADLVALADSAAAGAIKKMSVANLLFGAAAWPAETIDGAQDLLAIFNTSDGTIRAMTVGKLVLQAPPGATNLGNTDYLFLANSSTGAVRAQSFTGMITQAPALTAPDSADQISIYDTSAATRKNITLATLITGLTTTLTSPAGTELLQCSVSGALQKVSLSTIRTFAGGAFSYAIVVQKQNQGVQGGAALGSGVWSNRTFNTLVYDPDGVVGQTNGYIVLSAGTYRFRARAPGYECGVHRVRLYNDTDASLVFPGGPAARSTTNVQTTAELSGRFTIAANKHLYLQHYVSISQGSTDFGIAVNAAGEDEYYCTLELWREN